MRLLAAALAILVLPDDCLSLTKTLRRIGDLDERAWNRSPSCTVRYYNYCNGWVWSWGDWPPESRFGVGHGPTTICTDYGYGVEFQWYLTLSDSPAGYGYTGTIELSVADASYCPTSPVASQTFLPAYGWNLIRWNLFTMPPQFFTTIATTGTADGDPLVLVTDAPSTAPCRPPLNRTHSFTYGTKSDPVCPGEPFQDGAYHAELFWSVEGNIVDTGELPTSLRETSWGRLKTMFR